jgi:hypothetical protein
MDQSVDRTLDLSSLSLLTLANVPLLSGSEHDSLPFLQLKGVTPEIEQFSVISTRSSSSRTTR